MFKEEVLEPYTKFSESLIWKLQEEAYKRFGPSAWSEKGVPFYVTSNPWTAHAYLKVVEGFLIDLEKKGFKETVYLFDLGAGSGRLAFLFLQSWMSSSFRKTTALTLKYVMTDIAEANLEFWKKHQLLKPYFDEGLLDCAFFKPGQQENGIILQNSQEKLEDISSPLILLANYFFDTIPQELYKVENGNLQQGMIELKVNAKVTDRLDPMWISYARFNFRYDPLEERPSPWEALLKEHASKMKTGTFLFPIGAFQTVDYFRKLSKGPILLLAQDQGFAFEEHWLAQPETKLSLHASFSLAVSYYSLKRYVELLGGQALVPRCPSAMLVTFAGILAPFPCLQTVDAYEERVGKFDPWAYREILHLTEKHINNLAEMVNLIRFGRCDPVIIYTHFQKIRDWIKGANVVDRQALLKTVIEASEIFYPIGEQEADFFNDLGVLCIDLQAFEPALHLFHRAQRLGSKHAAVEKNIQLMLLSLQNHLFT